MTRLSLHIEAGTKWPPFRRKHVRFKNISALVQMLACRLVGAKPISEPMMVILLTHISVTRSQ